MARMPVLAGAPEELDFSDAYGDDYESLARDRVPVRSLQASDLDSLVRIDRKITGRDRDAYMRTKVQEALEESGVRVSVVAEMDGRVAGFAMARVDFGEFGRTEPEAVIDTVGVDPAYAYKGVGTALMSQLLLNLRALQVERVRTQIAANNIPLLNFLSNCGFRPSQRLAFSRPVP